MMSLVVELFSDGLGVTAFCGVVISTVLTICQVLFRHYRCENEVQFSTVRETLVCWE